MSKRPIILAVFMILSSASVGCAQNTTPTSHPSPPTTQQGGTEENTAVTPRVNPPLPQILAGSHRPPALPAEEGTWVLQIITRGGLTGGGGGDITITSQGSVSCTQPHTTCVKNLSSDALQPLAQFVMAPQLAGWGRSSLSICNDCYVTLLVLHRHEAGGEERTYIAYWDDMTQAKVPVGLMR